MQEKAERAVHSQLEASAAMLEFLMETDDNIVVMTADLAGSSKLKKNRRSISGQVYKCRYCGTKYDFYCSRIGT